MQTGDKVLLIFLAAAVCCFVLPFAPGELRDWIFRGPGWFVVMSVIVAAMHGRSGKASDMLWVP